VTFLLILGFPLAMGLAWVYNITEEGLVRDVGEEQARKMGPEGKSFPSNGVLIGLLVLIAGLLLYPRFTGPVEALPSEPVQKKSPVSQPAVSQEDRAAASLDPQSVAVLYSDDNSPGDTLTALADGLTEHLIHRLAQVGDLEIISRHGVEPYREQSLPLDSIARSLGAGSLVEGSVKPVGDSIAVFVQLIDGESQSHLMSEVVRRPAKEVFALQNSAASGARLPTGTMDSSCPR